MNNGISVFCIRHDSECIKKDDGYWYCKDGYCGVIKIQNIQEVKQVVNDG